MSRMLAIASKEIRQLRRDRLTFGMIVGIPLMQMLLFGYAINFDVRGLSAGVVDEARTSMSRALVADMQASGVVRVTRVRGFRRRAAAQPALRRSVDRRVHSRGFRAAPPGSATVRSRSCSSTAASRRSRTSRAHSWPCRCRTRAGMYRSSAAGVRGPHRVQPGEAHGRADRARADRRDPDDDHDDVHGRGDRARARARQPRAADHHAGQPARADARQARAVRVHRPAADHAGAAARRAAVPGADQRQPVGASTWRRCCSSPPR